MLHNNKVPAAALLCHLVWNTRRIMLEWKKFFVLLATNKLKLFSYDKRNTIKPYAHVHIPSSYCRVFIYLTILCCVWKFVHVLMRNFTDCWWMSWDFLDALCCADLYPAQWTKSHTRNENIKFPPLDADSLKLLCFSVDMEDECCMVESKYLWIIKFSTEIEARNSSLWNEMNTFTA